MKSTRRPHTSADKAKVRAAYREFIKENDRLARQLEETGVRGRVRQSDTEFAASRGISRSTLHRWLVAEPKQVAVGPPILTDVNHSIKVLMSDGAAEWEFIAAALNFSAWFVYPLSYFQRCSRTLSLAADRLGTAGDLDTFDILPIEVQKALHRFISTGLLRRLSNVYDLAFGDHDYDRIYDTSYTERDILKAIGFKFLDAHKRGESISINKVGGLLENGRLLNGLSIGPTFFSSLWKGYAPTIPYLCAESSAAFEWHLTFDEKLDHHLNALVSDTRRVREYFQIAHRYSNQFRSVLDPRAWNRIAMPAFSDETIAAI